jgi:phospholipase D1/2
MVEGAAASPSTMTQHSILEPGSNCAEVAQADRVALLFDAQDYFAAFARAAENAERSILILGWDFDSRVVLEPDAQGKGTTLGDFLNGLARRNRRLRVRILDWDFPIVYGKDREMPSPTYGVTWKPHRRIDFRLDDQHPLAGSHHQKVVVIDDKLAFVGGLDLTNKRWDTTEHRADDPRRVFEGDPYPPMHDVVVAFDGGAATAAAKIARDRWHAATLERLHPVSVANDPWPRELDVAVTDAAVGLALSAPAFNDAPAVRQIEQLYLDMIAAARKSIYIENQYFTSQRIAQALAARLAEPDGPEIVLVTRLLSHGWLEEVTMHVLRTNLVRALREGDRHSRFHAYYPHVECLPEGTCVDLHSKVMIVDDEWLRVGSSNLSNRSMGMDTECDALIEARGDARIRSTIRAFRDQLIAEHAGAEPQALSRAIDAKGSMAAAIAAHGTPARKLARLETPEHSESALTMASIGDPEAPLTFERIVERIAPEATAPRFPARRVAVIFGLIVAAAVGLALLWKYTPLADFITRENALRVAQAFQDHWWAPAAVILAYTPASFVMFPRWLITMTAVIAFGPYEGFVYGSAGMVLAALVTYFPGRLVANETVRRLAGPRMQRIANVVKRRGLLAVSIVRLVPVAPFPVVNLVLGALRVRLRHFVFGTMIGMLPGMLAATVLSDQLAAALEDPTSINWWLVTAALAMLLALAWFGQRWLRRSHH